MKIEQEKVAEINSIQDKNERIYKAALMYVEEGMYVLPIVKNDKKLPPKEYGISYEHATNKKATIKKWFGPGGKFEGWNIGLACGRENGVFVVDLDEGIDKKTEKKKNGIKNWFLLADSEGYVYNGPEQQTTSGGRHMLFQWEPNATSSTGKIAKDIDTRGGTESAFKGHIVVWPSETSSGKYNWVNGGKIPKVPEWLIDRLGQSWSAPKGSGRGNELVQDEDSSRKYTLDEISNMLKYVDPDADDMDYDRWLSVGQAIHSQHPNAGGLALWDTWSRTGRRYDPGECHVRWDGFREGGGITIGTLVFLAKEGGMPGGRVADSEDFSDDENYGSLIDKMNKEFCIIPVGGDVYVLQKRTVPEEMVHEPKYVLFKRSGFKALLENQRIPMVDGNGRTVLMSVADVWLTDENRKTYPMGLGMFPGKPSNYMGYYNMWEGFSVEPKKGDWSLFDKHILEIICNNDNGIYKWVIDWLADMVQDPANPKGTALVMQGVEGCGKGLFANIIGRLFGPHYKYVADEDHLVGKFNMHLADAVVVFADEVIYGGSKKAASKLKSMVTESLLPVEKKGVDSIHVRNNIHLIMASNEKWFIPAGPESRRWMCLAVSPDMVDNIKYFNKIKHQMFEEGGLSAMLFDLMHHKITANLRKAPETDLLASQRSQYSAMDSAVDWWSNQLDRGQTDFSGMDDDDSKWPATAVCSKVFDSYMAWCVEFRRKPVAKNRFYDTMTELGLEMFRPREGREGGRPRSYRLPSIAEGVRIIKAKYSIDLTMSGEQQ